MPAHAPVILRSAKGRSGGSKPPPWARPIKPGGHAQGEAPKRAAPFETSPALAR